MRRLDPRLLLPALGLAACALAASYLVVHAGGSRSLVYAAALLLALAIPATDLWRSRLEGLPLRLSAASLILAGAVILAGVMVGMDDPRKVQELMPVLIAVAATAQLRDRRCFSRGAVSS